MQFWVPFPHKLHFLLKLVQTSSKFHLFYSFVCPQNEAGRISHFDTPSKPYLQYKEKQQQQVSFGNSVFSKFYGKGQFSLCVPPVECRSGIGICGRGSDYLGSSVTRDTRDPWEFTTSYSRQWRGWGTDAACTQLLQTTPTQSGDMVSCQAKQTEKGNMLALFSGHIFRNWYK